MHTWRGVFCMSQAHLWSTAKILKKQLQFLKKQSLVFSTCWKPHSRFYEHPTDTQSKGFCHDSWRLIQTTRLAYEGGIMYQRCKAVLVSFRWIMLHKVVYKAKECRKRRTLNGGMEGHTGDWSSSSICKARKYIVLTYAGLTPQGSQGQILTPPPHINIYILGLLDPWPLHISP